CMCRRVKSEAEIRTRDADSIDDVQLYVRFECLPGNFFNQPSENNVAKVAVLELRTRFGNCPRVVFEDSVKKCFLIERRMLRLKVYPSKRNRIWHSRSMAQKLTDSNPLIVVEVR